MLYGNILHCGYIAKLINQHHNPPWAFWWPLKMKSSLLDHKLQYGAVYFFNSLGNLLKLHFLTVFFSGRYLAKFSGNSVNCLEIDGNFARTRQTIKLLFDYPQSRILSKISRVMLSNGSLPPPNYGRFGLLVFWNPPHLL